MSAAPYMVSIETDMQMKNLRAEEPNGSGAASPRKKKKLSVADIPSQQVQWWRSTILESGYTTVTNKKNAFDKSVRCLKAMDEPLNSEIEHNEEKRAIKSIGVYLNAITAVMKSTTKFDLWTNTRPLPVSKELADLSPTQMKNKASKPPEEDSDDDDEEEESSDESDEESEDDVALIDTLQRSGYDSKIVVTRGNFYFLVIKLIRALGLGEQRISMPQEELQFLSNAWGEKKEEWGFKKPSNYIQGLLKQLLARKPRKDVIKTLEMLWDKDEYILQLLLDLNFSTDDTPLEDVKLLKETKKKFKCKRITTLLVEKEIQDAIKNALTTEEEDGSTAKNLKKRKDLLQEMRNLEQMGISSLEAQPEAMEEGDGPRKSSRKRKSIERLRGVPFEVPRAAMDAGLYNIGIRISELKYMKKFLKSLNVIQSSNLVEPMTMYSQGWIQDLNEMLAWGNGRVQSREKRYKNEADLIQAQHSQQSDLKYQHGWTRFYLFRKTREGDWIDVSGMAENGDNDNPQGVSGFLHFYDWDSTGPQNPGNTTGLVVSIHKNQLSPMDIKKPDHHFWTISKRGYSIKKYPKKKTLSKKSKKDSDDDEEEDEEEDEKYLMRIDDPTLFAVQRVSELRVADESQLQVMGLSKPEVHIVTFGTGYTIWNSCRYPGKYWMRIDDPDIFVPLVEWDDDEFEKGLDSHENSDVEEDDEDEPPWIGLSYERRKALEEFSSAREKLERQRSVTADPEEDMSIEDYSEHYRQSYKDLGLDEQYIEVAVDLCKKGIEPRDVLQKKALGQVVQQRHPHDPGDLPDGYFKKYFDFQPFWRHKRAGPELKFFLEALKSEEARGRMPDKAKKHVEKYQDGIKRECLLLNIDPHTGKPIPYYYVNEVDKEELMEREAIEEAEDAQEAIEAETAYHIKKDELTAQLQHIQNKIETLQGSEEGESGGIQQLFQERERLEKLETLLDHSRYNYGWKHEQLLLRAEMQRLSNEWEEEEARRRPASATASQKMLKQVQELEARRRERIIERFIEDTRDMELTRLSRNAQRVKPCQRPKHIAESPEDVERRCERMIQKFKQDMIELKRLESRNAQRVKLSKRPTLIAESPEDVLNTSQSVKRDNPEALDAMSEPHFPQNELLDRELAHRISDKETGGSAASRRSGNELQGNLKGMFSQQLDKDLDDVHLSFLSLEPTPDE